MFAVQYSKQALRELKKLDKHDATLIVSWVRKHLDGCENPRAQGKPLGHNLKGRWRYRIGDFRLFARIEDEKLTIIVLTVGHRREIYRQQ